MANIAVNNYCSLKCPYCFADEMIHEKSCSISIDNLRIILDWLSRTPKNHVGIIGGEPTLHPHFDEILKEINIYCRNLNTTATLFTNGIDLDKFLPDIGNRISILINTNSPNNMEAEKYSKLLDTLDHLDLLCWYDDRVTLGCNVYRELDDYSYIWELVDKYHLRRLRTSVTAPNPKLNMGKEEYYLSMKDKFINFCKDAIEHHCVLNIDCNHIPECYYTDEEFSIYNDAIRDPDGRIPLPNSFCNPVVDITGNFKATACFGSYDPIDIRDFDNLDELERYLLFKKSYPRYCNNGTGRCSTCKKYKLMQCQGGCLGFGGKK